MTYTPTGTETDSATMTIQSNVTTPPAPPVIALTGQAIQEQKCYYSLTPTSLNWGQVKPLGRPTPLHAGLHHHQPGAERVPGERREPAPGQRLRLLDDAGGEPAALGSGRRRAFPTQLIVPVAFFPQQPGSYAGVVGFTISDPDGPNVRVPLVRRRAATSCFLVKPADLNFGVVGLSNGQYCAKGKKTSSG